MRESKIRGKVYRYDPKSRKMVEIQRGSENELPLITEERVKMVEAQEIEISSVSDPKKWTAEEEK